ncbi:MAG: hypothetical protein ACOYB3_01185 [Azonexus sp.]
MNALNEFGKRFVVLFGVSLLVLALCMMAELCWRKLVAWLHYHSASELLGRLLQDHPVLSLVVILWVMSMLGAAASMRDRK